MKVYIDVEHKLGDIFFIIYEGTNVYDVCYTCGGVKSSPTQSLECQTCKGKGTLYYRNRKFWKIKECTVDAVKYDKQGKLTYLHETWELEPNQMLKTWKDAEKLATRLSAQTVNTK